MHAVEDWATEDGIRRCSQFSQSIIEDKDELAADVWMDEGLVAYAPGVVWVEDKTVAAALPAACTACLVSGVAAGVVPVAVVAGVYPLNRKTLRLLPGLRRLYPCQR
jgi:hypothetical protein